jgi:hypothetical protein
MNGHDGEAEDIATVGQRVNLKDCAEIIYMAGLDY